MTIYKATINTILFILIHGIYFHFYHISKYIDIDPVGLFKAFPIVVILLNTCSVLLFFHCKYKAKINLFFQLNNSIFIIHCAYLIFCLLLLLTPHIVNLYPPGVEPK